MEIYEIYMYEVWHNGQKLKGDCQCIDGVIDNRIRLTEFGREWNEGRQLTVKWRVIAGLGGSGHGRAEAQARDQ